MSKLIGVKDTITIHHDQLRQLGVNIMQHIGCSHSTAQEISNHLVDADLSGVHSHGTMRFAQYVKQAHLQLWTPSASPRVHQTERGGAWFVDGQNSIGITAVRVGVQVAVDNALKLTNSNGIACVGVVNCGHTGRIGEFAEEGARRGCLTFIIGGGSRQSWRQVAPYGGTKGLLPTNPYSISIPGDVHGMFSLSSFLFFLDHQICMYCQILHNLFMVLLFCFVFLFFLYTPRTFHN